MIRDNMYILAHDFRRRYKKEMGHKYGRKFRSSVKALSYDIGRRYRNYLLTMEENE